MTIKMSGVKISGNMSNKLVKISSAGGGGGLVTSGLLMNLDAATYSGSGDWLDTVNSNNAVLYNSPTYNSSGPNAWFDFDGVDQYASIAAGGLVYGAGPRTVSVWAKAPSTFVHFDYGTQETSKAFIFSRNGNNPAYSQYGYEIDSNTDVVPNAWYNMVITVDNVGLTTMYLNGVQVAQGSMPYDTDSTDAWMARYLDGSFYAGSVAQALMYNRDLSGAEVLQNFNATKSRYGL